MYDIFPGPWSLVFPWSEGQIYSYEGKSSHEDQKYSVRAGVAEAYFVRPGHILRFKVFELPSHYCMRSALAPHFSPFFVSFCLNQL